MLEKVKEIIAEQLDKDADSITLETNISEDLDVDSLDLFQIVSDIEDEFDVEIQDVEKIKTIAELIEVIEKSK